MQDRIPRRTVVRAGLAAGALIPTPGLFAGAATTNLPPFDPIDPTAQALGFVNATTKVDPVQNPTHKPIQKYESCAQIQGKAGQDRDGCNIFAYHSVPRGGWCGVWAQSPRA